MPEWWDQFGRHVCFIIVCIVTLFAAHWDIDDDSPTEDEWAHVTRGIAIWNHGDTRLSYAHPPLANVIALAPVALREDLPDLTQSAHWDGSMDPGDVAYDMLVADYEGYRDILMEARRPIALFLILGLVYVYFFCLEFWGWRTAITAAIFIGWNPVIIGQARYLTTDLAAAVVFVVVAGELVRHLAGGRPIRTWITFPLAIAISIVTKHTGAVLAALCMLVCIGVALARRGPYLGLSRKHGLKACVRHWIGISLIVAFLINLAYGFQRTGWRTDEILDAPEPQYWVSSNYEDELLDRTTMLKYFPGLVRVPLPYTYMFGLACVAAQNRRGYSKATFFGYRTPYGHPLYFPVLLATKTPLAILLLVGGGAVALVRHRKQAPLPVVLLVALTLLFFLVLIRSRLNMGIRHGLPAEMMLALFAAIFFDAAWRRFEASAVQRVALALLPLSLLLGLLDAAPNYLGWSSALVGRKGGQLISPVGDDWGQDRTALVEHVEKMGYKPLYYHSQTETRALELSYLGLEYTELECDTVPPPEAYIAIHNVQIRALSYKCWAWLTDVELIDHVNHHVFIFRMTDFSDTDSS